MGHKGEAIRQRIVNAADQLFYQQGYDNTSFSDISDAVNISRGNFYYHFKSKDAILNAVINARLVEIRAMLAQWDIKYPDFKQRIGRYIDMLTHNEANIQQHGCPAGSLCMELSKINHTLHNDAAQIMELFCDWLTLQFVRLGHQNAKQLAMHLLARGQGIATIVNSFNDTEFLSHEVKELKRWLEEL